MTDSIRAHLAERDLLPHEHLLDSGYGAADVLVTSRQQHMVGVVGPALSDTSWQARQLDGLDVRCFTIDRDARQVSCPTGKVSTGWTAGHDDQGLGQVVIAIQFDRQDCQGCALRPRCTQAKDGPRAMKLRSHEQHEALQSARKRQTTEAFKQLYAGRAGIEGTLSQGVRAFGLRSARYIGQAKTHLQHILIAVAINIVRVVAWIQEIPRATPRTSAFARLVATLS